MADCLQTLNGDFRSIAAISAHLAARRMNPVPNEALNERSSWDAGTSSFVVPRCVVIRDVVVVILGIERDVIRITRV